MKGLKITQTSGVSEIISDANVYSITFAAPTKVGSLSQMLLITACGYAKPVATVLTYFNDTVAAYNGANVLYQYGELTDTGSFKVIASNQIP
jgi:hypothetical protein